MLVTESQIRRLVRECLCRILEYHHAIDEKMRGIATIIVDRMNNGENKFTLAKDEIQKYYPYNNPAALNVLVTELKSKWGTYSSKTKTLMLSNKLRLFDTEYAIEATMHELTHFVEDNENGGNKKNIYIPKPENTKEKLINDIQYLFSDSEMQGRITQFKEALKRTNNTRQLESVTRLNQMSRLIDYVEAENYDEYYNSFGNTNNYGTIIEGMLEQRAYYKSLISGKDKQVKLLSKNEFNAAKSAIIKDLKKKYKRFKVAIDKNYYDYSILQR